MSKEIVVVGAGAFGTALAKVVAESGHRTHLVARSLEVVEAINTCHRHPTRLQGCMLPAGIQATADASVLNDADMVISALPTSAIRGFWTAHRELVSDGVIWVCAAKGIEQGTMLLVSEVMSEVLGQKHREQLTYLSGPSFATELVQRMPTLVTLAGNDMETLRAAQSVLSTDYFRVYTSLDVVGVEIGGALKNVMAIAAGMAEGLGMGLNTQAAIITRGLVEISRLAVARGAKPQTLSGLSGLGDLVLTCTGNLSRNRRVGVRLGRGETLKEIQGDMLEVAEGVLTAKSARGYAAKAGIEMPITETVYQVLYEGLAPRDGVASLMTRELKPE